jgi:diacylglycerol kinase family enzyme
MTDPPPHVVNELLLRTLAWPERHRQGEMGPRSDDASEREVSIGADRRALAFAALVAMVATIVVALAGLVQHPLVIAISSAAAALVVEGVILIVTASGKRRPAGAAMAIVGAIAWIWILIDGEAFGFAIGIIVGTAISTLLAVWALRPRPYRPPGREPRLPTKPFILMNPRSGGGKVRKFDLDTKARNIGAEVSYLEPGTDAEAVLRRAVQDGADLLGAAGGDGTQALVAQVAAEHDIPIVCIPAGTRNHFALDLGLDRNDPSLALDAIGDQGEEILTDLGRVADRPFVNNVSLGVYAEIVSRPGYRDAKFVTVMTVLPDVTDPSARSGLTVEAEGQSPVRDPQLVQVANNPYAGPDDASRAGTRPRLDTGVLGVDAVAYRSPTELRGLVAEAIGGAAIRSKAYRSWTGRKLRVSSNDGVVHAGVDGEAVEFPSPVDISIAPGALRVRVPKDRPGQKIGWPRLDRRIVIRLWSILIGARNAGAS